VDALNLSLHSSPIFSSSSCDLSSWSSCSFSPGKRISFRSRSWLIRHRPRRPSASWNAYAGVEIVDEAQHARIVKKCRSDGGLLSRLAWPCDAVTRSTRWSAVAEHAPTRCTLAVATVDESSRGAQTARRKPAKQHSIHRVHLTQSGSSSRRSFAYAASTLTWICI
jgi:hypothetical protein